MTRRPSIFTQDDVKRVVKGAKDGGFAPKVVRVTVTKEKLDIVMATSDGELMVANGENPWDTVLKHDADPKRPS
jgi:hypothetical protein